MNIQPNIVVSFMRALLPVSVLTRTIKTYSKGRPFSNLTRYKLLLALSFEQQAIEALTVFQSDRTLHRDGGARSSS